MKGDIELKHNQKPDKAVVLYHGLTGAPGELYHLANTLHQAGFDVYCPILPGHCRGTEALKETRWREWYDFSISEVDRHQQDYKDIYVGGMCLGAVLALGVATERKSVKGIAALSTTLYLNGWSLPWFKFLLPLALYTIMKFFYAFPEGGAFGVKNKDARQKVKVALEKKDTYLDCFPIICVLELLKLSRFMRKRLQKVEAPLVIFHSNRDDLTNTKSAEIVVKKVSSKNVKYHILKNSYHLITLDNEKDFVFSETVNFFNGVSQ